MCKILRASGQNVQISTVDVTRCSKLSSHWQLRGTIEGVESFSLLEDLFQQAAKHYFHDLFVYNGSIVKRQMLLYYVMFPPF